MSEHLSQFLSNPLSTDDDYLMGHLLHSSRRLGIQIEAENGSKPDRPQQPQLRGVAVGESVGDIVGDTLGDVLGDELGESLGLSVGDVLGEALGAVLGLALGAAVGSVHTSE